MKTLLSAALVATILACDSGTDASVTGTVTITPASATLSIGDTIRFRAAVTEFTGDTTIQWITLDGHIASVDANGLVTAQSVGVADIAARVKSAPSVIASVRVNVTGSGQ